MITAGTAVRILSGPYQDKTGVVQDDSHLRNSLRVIVVDRDGPREVYVAQCDVEVVNDPV